MKKELIGIFVCVLLVGTVLPVTGTVINIDRTSFSNRNGKILYVGGSGPNNYTTIQSAINDAWFGDTVFVYDESSPYFENIIIDRSINLIGKDKNTTVIDGENNFKSAIIQIEAGFVSIQGFTIFDSYYGIQLFTNNNEIKDNIIRDNHAGIQLGEELARSSHDNIIKGNMIENNELGIVLDGASSNNIISHNVISSNIYHGVFLRYGNCENNVIKNNYIVSNGQLGIWILSSDSNLVKHNNIVKNKHSCVSIDNSHNNLVFENNIYNDKFFSAGLNGHIFDLLRDNWLKNNIFDSNYWGRPRERPQPIIAVCEIFIFPIFLIIYDSNPAQEPYDIGI